MIRRGGLFVAGVLTGLLSAGLVLLVTAPPRGQPVHLASPPSPAPLHVHITGAVVQPGVYSLPVGTMVQDAVAAAGGPSSDAALQAVNLAQPLADGIRITIPRQADLEDAQTAPPTFISGGSSTQSGERININTADAPALERLPGIGPSLAQKIVDFRESHGPFGQPEDLQAVPGIGPAKFEAVKDLITTE